MATADEPRTWSPLEFRTTASTFEVLGARSTVAALTEDVTSADNYHQEAAILMPVGGETHGGTDVVLHAIGRGAEGFHGIMDNTEVLGVLRASSGL